MTSFRPKLIEVALPLATISREAAREKSIRHGHPSDVAFVVGSSSIGGHSGGDLGVVGR